MDTECRRIFSCAKDSTKRDALAYAYFNYAAGQKKTAKEVSELTRAARKCGEALRGEGGNMYSDSDSSRTSNSSPEKKRKARKCFGDRPRMQYQYAYQKAPVRQFAQRLPVQQTVKGPEKRSCCTCKTMGHIAKDCAQQPRPVIKKEN